jgi:L-alanine-DL-glutamate epimerase-like enolase superfamily enzyme
MRRLVVREESWPLVEPFVISRLRQEASEVVVVEITENGVTGRGETERAEAFDPNRPKVAAEIEAVRVAIERGAGRDDLPGLMPAGYARAAVDCALWDLEAKLAGEPAWRLAGLAQPRPVTTVFTLGLGSVEKMAAAAAKNADRPILKIKLGAEGDAERIAAIRTAAPNCRLIADANEGWTPETLQKLLHALADAKFELLEQPLPAGRDEALGAIEHPVPVCADESFHDRADLPGLTGRYDFVNIKLDKTGGLTEGLAAARAAQAAGYRLMVGCNVGTSLSMAPAHLVAQMAEFVDIDGPLLLSRDRKPGLVYRDGLVEPPIAALWG